MLLTVGLEIHIKLSSPNKLFCTCANIQDFESVMPNTNICPTCTAQPGALPVLSQEPLDLAVRLGLCLGCKINEDSNFDRKSYFYPDSPTGYQITQFYHPTCTDGQIEFFVDDDFQNTRKIRIRDAHIENDTAKTIHLNGQAMLDFNRAGTPLVEIVTEPDFTDADEVVAFLKELQRIARYNGISDADMDKGQMRVDVNISIRKNLSDDFGQRVEMKNVSSFGAIKNAILNEYARQVSALANGESIQQETRMRDDMAGASTVMRTKETALDYRYFPEPDLGTVKINDNILGITNGKKIQNMTFSKDNLNIFIVRHGETLENAQGILQGHLNGKLSAKGVQQAKNLAEKLDKFDIDMVYCSDLGRTKETIAPFLSKNPKIGVFYDDRIRERFLGKITGKIKPDFEKLHPGKTWEEINTIYDIENDSEMMLRSSEFIKEILSKHKNGNILIVGHAGANRGLMTNIEGKDRMDYDFKSENCQISKYSLDNEGKIINRILNFEVQSPIVIPFDIIQNMKNSRGFHKEYINSIVNSKPTLDYFNELVSKGHDPKLIAKRISGPINSYLNKNLQEITGLPFDIEKMSDFLLCCDRLPSNQQKVVMDEMLMTGGKPADIIQKNNFGQNSSADLDISSIADQVIASHASVVEQYKAGKTSSIMFLVGQLMKLSQGKANPEKARGVLEEKLG